MNIEVTRQIHIPAPADAAVYAHPTYARASGAFLIEDIRHAAMHVKSDGSKHYYPKRLFRRRSEDGGETWREEPDFQTRGPEQLEGAQRYQTGMILDPVHDVLINLYFTHEVDLGEGVFSRGNLIQRTQRTYYELSHDGGDTWTGPHQVIDARTDYDEKNWAPGIVYGIQGAHAAGQHAFLPDGAMVIGFSVMHPEKPASFPDKDSGYYITTIYGQARLADDRDGLEWCFGEEISVEYPKSSMGCGEPALLWLGGTRLFNTMRCQGSKKHGIYSTRYTTLSEDGGITWSDPVPLTYDDGSTVWTPASPHRFFVSSRTDKTYVIANFLPAPVHDQRPRYPLGIAEFDTDRLCVLRDSVAVIQDLPEGAPKSRRYTNFGMYEERGSGDLILTMPEQPKKMDFEAMTRPEDFESDCIQWRVRLLH